MPTPPKLLNTLCRIGIAKVDRNIESEHTAKSARHIRITGKIKVNLQGEGGRPHPCSQYTDAVRQRAQTVP